MSMVVIDWHISKMCVFLDFQIAQLVKAKVANIFRAIFFEEIGTKIKWNKEHTVVELSNNGQVQPNNICSTVSDSWKQIWQGKDCAHFQFKRFEDVAMTLLQIHHINILIFSGVGICLFTEISILTKRGWRSSSTTGCYNNLRAT